MSERRRSENSIEFADFQYKLLVRQVLAGIEEIKRRHDTITLDRVRRASRSMGKKRGPPRQKDKTEWIALLHKLAAGEALKVAVQRPRKAGSASAELGRYCLEFYRWCHWLSADTPELWQQEGQAAIFRDELGFDFPRDLAAAKEAYRRGKETFDKSIEDFKRFLTANQSELPQLPSN